MKAFPSCCHWIDRSADQDNRDKMRGGTSGRRNLNDCAVDRLDFFARRDRHLQGVTLSGLLEACPRQMHVVPIRSRPALGQIKTDMQMALIGQFVKEADAKTETAVRLDNGFVVKLDH